GGGGRGGVAARRSASPTRRVAARSARPSAVPRPAACLCRVCRCPVPKGERIPAPIPKPKATLVSQRAQGRGEPGVHGHHLVGGWAEGVVRGHPAERVTRSKGPRLA